MSIAGNKNCLWAVAVFLMIPVIMVGGGALFNAIDPERLAGHTHYVRNFNLLQGARIALWLAMLGLAAIAWFAACLLVLRSKHRTYRWLPLALFGPVGLAILVSLRDLDPEPTDLYERFIRRLGSFVRVAYEIGFLILAWSLAWWMMLMQREAIISFQSAMTGLSKDQILDQQNASGGMWAFGEMLEVMCYLVLLYLLRPICVNLAGFLFENRRASRRMGGSGRVE